VLAGLTLFLLLVAVHSECIFRGFITLLLVILLRRLVELAWEARGLKAWRRVVPIWIPILLPMYFLAGPVVPLLWEEYLVGSWPPSRARAGMLCASLQALYLALSILPWTCPKLTILVGLGNFVPLSYREGRYIVKFSKLLYLTFSLAWFVLIWRSLYGWPP